MTGKEEGFDESTIDSALDKANDFMSNPVFQELAPTITEGVGDFNPKPGDSFTDIFNQAVERIRPVLEKVMPMATEMVPEGVTMDGDVQNDFNSPKEDEIEIVPKDST
jgi:hypothetical protein